MLSILTFTRSYFNDFKCRTMRAIYLCNLQKSKIYSTVDILLFKSIMVEHFFIHLTICPSSAKSLFLYAYYLINGWKMYKYDFTIRYYNCNIINSD